MSGFSRLMEVYQFFHMFEAHHQQRLAWEDAEVARIARIRAEQLAAAQVRDMLIANPSGQLGTANRDDEEALRRGGLL